MDCVIPTHDRPVRLSCTLATLLGQQGVPERRLYLLDNSENDVLGHVQVRKMMAALRLAGWNIDVSRTRKRSIPSIKREALGLGTSRHIVLIDNDVLFTRADTVAELDRVLREYDVAAASPIAFDVDEDRAVLTPYIDAYTRHPADEHGIAEGDVALGLCLAVRRADVEGVIDYWIDALGYMEDQVLVHFLKVRRGYAYLTKHSVYHVGYAETPSYEFDDDEAVRVLERLASEDPAYDALLALRRDRKDGAEFSRSVKRLKT